MNKTKIIELSKKLKVYNLLKRIQLIDNRLDIRNRSLKTNGELCLNKLKSSFDSIGVHFWLDYGTLLGVVRDGDFIGHDLDMDISVSSDSNKQEIEKALSENGFSKIQDFLLDGQVVEETYTFNNIEIDLFYCIIENLEMKSYAFERNIPNYKVDLLDTKKILYPEWVGFSYTSTYAGFKNIQFKDMTFSVPKNTDKYLKENYGKEYMKVKKRDWEVPNKKKVNNGKIIQRKYD